MEIKEPKFKPGQRVRDLEDGDIYTVESINSYRFMQDEYWYNLAEHLCVMPESALELYIDKSKTVWDLKIGDKCCFIDDCGTVLSGTWANISFAIKSRQTGNVFLTKEEAENEAERRKIETEMLRLGGRRTFKKGEDNFSISFTYLLSSIDEKTTYYNNGLSITNYSYSNIQGGIYFNSFEEAYNAIKKIGKSKIKKYIFGVNE